MTVARKQVFAFEENHLKGCDIENLPPPQQSSVASGLKKRRKNYFHLASVSIRNQAETKQFSSAMNSFYYKAFQHHLMNDDAVERFRSSLQQVTFATFGCWKRLWQFDSCLKINFKFQNFFSLKSSVGNYSSFSDEALGGRFKNKFETV